MKQRIRLAESDLHRIITESVRGILREADAFKNRGYSDLGDTSVEGQLDDYMNTPPLRKIRMEHGLRLNGYANVGGDTAILMDCSNMVSYDGENHGRRIATPIEEHCLAVSFDGDSYHLHILHLPNYKDVTRPLKLPMFNDSDREGYGLTPCYRQFNFMMRKMASMENKGRDNEGWTFSSTQYVDGSNDMPDYAEDRNFNIKDHRYGARDYVNNERDFFDKSKGAWERPHPSVTNQRNKSYRW